MKLTQSIIERRHPEWLEHQVRWQWLLDSFEGGERYRNAIYGYDRRGYPIRNLVRHKREYSDSGYKQGLELFTNLGASSTSTDDDFELRRSRTPVPNFLAEVVETHISRIYAREVKRTGPELLQGWWSNVDGNGTPIDQWMVSQVAPLLLVLGQLDLCFDHPALDSNDTIESLADQRRHGLNCCIATCILPEQMLWWKLDSTGMNYDECLVEERILVDDEVEIAYRHWTTEESVQYDAEGQVLRRTPHCFGRVPIIRVFDSRKPRTTNVGQSRYESIAERQREYYNRDSELILSDTSQAHPLLQGPEDYVQPDGTIPVGPSWLLPKKKNQTGGSTSYEGFEVVSFPKDGAETLRRNKAELRDEIDRDAALVRATGRDGRATSGIAKMIDHADGNMRLAKIARSLAHAERTIAEAALSVLIDGRSPTDLTDQVQIVYPAEFDLYTTTDVAKAIAEFQALVASAGLLPLCEGLMLGRLVRLCLPGMSDAQYLNCEQEIQQLLDERSVLTLDSRRSRLGSE